MTKRILFVVIAFFATLSFGSSARGQAIGSFSGTITDKSGSAIAAATVTVTAQGTGVVREAKTDETGHYIINYLPVGLYTIHVEFQGFQPAETKDVRLQIDESRELDFALNPASVSSTVEVVADAVTVQTTNPTLGQVITSQEVAQLPLNGRDFVQLATLTPGTTQETNPSSFFNGGPSSEVSARGSYSLSVGGSRANSTDWLLDGNDNNELTAGGIGILSSIDSIQEFKVLTYNYSAEFGTRAGPTVLVTTKSGSNSFHGTLFEFLRNTSLDAKSFFATKPEKFNLNQFGGGIGGPIRKNKTFFFVDGEQKFQRHGITFTGLVPSDAMRTGDFTNDAFGNPVPIGAVSNPNTFSGLATGNTPFQCDANGNPLALNPDLSQPAGTPCNKIPAGLFTTSTGGPSIGQQLIDLYPHANANNPTSGFNFVNSPVRKLDETKFDIRLDHNFSASDTAFARFSYDQAVSFVPGGAPGFAEQNAFASNQGIQNHARNISLSETHIFSPTMVNQVTGGYNRIFNYITSQGTGSCISQQLGIPGANINCDSSNNCEGSSCGLVSISPNGGFWGLGDRGFTPFQGGTNVFSISDSFDIIKGKHDIKMGLGVRANQMNVRSVGFQDGFWVMNGAYSGSPMADMIQGLSNIRIHDQNFNGDVTGRRWKIFRPYVQDDWRVTKDLTLNIGVAWSMATPVSESANRLANLVPSEGKMLVAGQNGVSSSAGVQMDWTALEPRIGLAYKLFGSDKTAIRAGYAIFHDSAWSQGAQGLWQNPPFAAESFGIVFQTPFSNTSFCTIATAQCAVTFHQQPTVGPGTADIGLGLGFSDGFPIIPTAPSATDLSSNFSNLIAENLSLKQGAVQQFNVNIEHQLPGQIVVTAGYAGSRAAHILNFGNNLNVGSPSACGVTAGYTLGCGPGGTSFGPPFLNPNNNVIYSANDYGRAHYNSFQIKAETKSSKSGLYALIGYTYSRNYDTGFTDGVGTSTGQAYFPLPNWGKLDWGLSQINLNNSFTASVIYDLPFGKGKKYGSSWNNTTNTLLGNWQINVIEKITSGFPVFVFNSTNSSGVNFNSNGNSFNRPNQVCDPNSGVHQNIGEWFNVSCFVGAPVGELGNANRTPVNGPDYVNTDFSVVKGFALPWENMHLDFRAEIFNLFNHAQFGLPGGDVGSPSQFGKINFTVNNPRLVQFGLKLNF